MALNAGIDVELPTFACYGEPLKAALRQGDISIELVDQAVRRHLRKKFELGLFENPYVDEGKVLDVFETPQQRELAFRSACKSMVLLKNDGLLPFPKSIKTLAVIGPNADDGRNQLGDYSYAAMRRLMEYKAPKDSAFLDVHGDAPSPSGVRITTILEGIRAAVSSETKVLFAEGCDNLASDKSGFDEAFQAAEHADAVVLVLGDRSGLTTDCTTGETRDSADLRLPGVQEDLAAAIFNTGKPVAVVLVTGRPYVLSTLAEKANAILEAWLPGEEGGAAVAALLFGGENPSGKLPITFPRTVGQVPIYYNAKPAGMKSHWYEDYVSEKAKPLYPFGHGLSFTSFAYGELSITPKRVTRGESLDISLQLSNIGKLTGEEVVQLYTHDEYACTPRPAKELKGFARVMLQPGETKRVTFHLPVDQLAFYDLNLNLILEPGRIEVMVGSSSEDIRLCGEFMIVGENVKSVQERVFTCPVSIE
jgi:beta-glucosidase